MLLKASLDNYCAIIFGLFPMTISSRGFGGGARAMGLWAALTGAGGGPPADGFWEGRDMGDEGIG